MIGGAGIWNLRKRASQVLTRLAPISEVCGETPNHELYSLVSPVAEQQPHWTIKWPHFLLYGPGCHPRGWTGKKDFLNEKISWMKIIVNDVIRWGWTRCGATIPQASDLQHLDSLGCTLGRNICNVNLKTPEESGRHW